MSQSVTAGLACEAVVAAVEGIVVDAAQALRAAVAELSRPLSATIARCHRLVESPETASLDLLTRPSLQILVRGVLRVVTLEGGRMMCRTCMSGSSSVRTRMLCTRMMLWICMRVSLGLRLGFHFDS